MSDCIIIVETCKRDRAKSGRWSSKTYDHKRQAWSEEQFTRATSADWKAFFGARETRRYTYLGYVPCRWTYEDPAGTGYVATYKVVRFDSLGYRERFALDNTIAIDLVEDARELAVVSYVTEDGEHRTCTFDLDNKKVVG